MTDIDIDIAPSGSSTNWEHPHINVRKASPPRSTKTCTISREEYKYWDEYFEARRGDWAALGKGGVEFPEEEEQRKHCKLCGVLHPVSEFYAKQNKKDGLDSTCRSCHQTIDHVRRREGTAGARRMREQIRDAAKKRVKRIGDTKRCPDCKRFLHHSEYYAYPRRGGGLSLSSYCKACMRKRSAERNKRRKKSRTK